MWSDWLVSCDFGFSLSALWHPLLACTGVSLTLDMGYFLMVAPAKCSHRSLPWVWSISSQLPLLTLDVGYLLSAAAPYLGHGVSPLDCSWESVYILFRIFIVCRYICVSCSVVSYSLQPMDCSLPGSCVHGVLQARVLEWVAITFSWGSPLPLTLLLFSWGACNKTQINKRKTSRSLLIDISHMYMGKWKWKLLSHIQLFVTPSAVQSMKFSRPKYWSA